MRLEEVLPAYREGRVIVSAKTKRKYHVSGSPGGRGWYIGAALESELLGDWTIEKKKVKKEVRGWLNVYPDGICGSYYRTREEADYIAGLNRIACVEFVHEYEVEE